MVDGVIIYLTNYVRSGSVPRQARVRSFSGFYHIIVRGNNKAAIFDNDLKKAYYLAALEDAVANELLELVAWCLMDNHIHMIVKADLEVLSDTIKSINIKYAMMHHRYYKTSGHVFQGRFLSQVIETDEYLITAVRYVHKNPVKAGIVVFPEQYIWSSYHKYLKAELTEPMLYVLKSFSGNLNKFALFHREEGGLNHLEIKVDKEKLRKEKAQKTIVKFCNEYGVDDSEILKHNKRLRDILVGELLQNCNMSLRGISGLLELPYSTVRGKKKGIKKNRP
jgi:REP element-mobilizing transposase RayT